MSAPHAAFQFMTLDEAAECLDGVTPELYRKLWDLMPADKDIPPRGEWPEPDSADRVARSLVAHWAKLDPAEQDLLNELASADEARGTGPDRYPPLVYRNGKIVDVG